MDDKLQHFVESIFSIANRRMGGAGIGTAGMGGAQHRSINTGNDMVRELEMHTLEFARQYKAKGESVHEFAQKIEGSLFGLQTVGALENKDMERLIDEMKALIERKKK